MKLAGELGMIRCTRWLHLLAAVNDKQGHGITLAIHAKSAIAAAVADITLSIHFCPA